MRRALPPFVACLGLWLAGLCFAGQPQRGRPGEGSLNVGDPAPDFELPRLDAKGTVKLSSFKDKRPVVLIFGSYT